MDSLILAFISGSRSYMKIVTLLTDWGYKDHYVAVLKGELLSQIKDVRIFDLSHEIECHNIIEGAHVLKNSWHHFPEGTIHIVGLVGSGVQFPSTIAVKHKGHYFLGCNDGLFSMALDQKPEMVHYLLKANGDKVRPSVQVFADGAAFLAGGGKIPDMGTGVEDFMIRTIFQPFVEDNSIRGNVIYIDAFGNVITNISKTLFESSRGDRKFDILLKGREYTLDTIMEDYRDVVAGNILCRFNSDGLLEIVMNEDSASGMLSLKYGQPIRVDFKV